MSKFGLQYTRVEDIDGHFHNPEWYRPLLFGENLYMNETYLLPGVELVVGSDKERAAEKLERAIYVTGGTLTVRRGQEQHQATAGSAFFVGMSGEPVSLKNEGSEAVSFVTVMSPPPHPELKLESREELRQRYIDNDRTIRDKKGMRELLGR